MTKVLDRVHVGDGGEVLVGIGSTVFGRIALSTNCAANEQLSYAVAVSVLRDAERIWKDAYRDPTDVDGLRPGWGSHETDITKVESINRSLEGLDGFYRSASIVPNQRAAGGVVPSLFEVGDGRCGQPVGVLRRD
jgi:hypothetical protein